MNNLDKEYQELLQYILDNGVEKQDRTGTGTLSVFGIQIRHKMSEGFPLLTTKKMYWKGIVTELLWFLRGDTNIKYLVDNGCNIWNGDAYKKYEEHILKQRELQKNKVQELRRQGKRVKVVKIELLSREEFINKIKTDDEFAKKWGDLGPVYGKQWRHWGGNIKRLTYGFIDKNDDGWVMRWSDLHSFGDGSHWCYTPIKNSDTINDSDIGKRVVFDFEADHEDFNPLKYVIINTDTKDEYENHVDQIENLIEQLKTNPDSRRNIVSAWNVAELDQMTLPPCHYGFQVYTRELSEGERMNTLAQNEQRLIYKEVQSFKNVRNKKIKDYLDERNVPTRAISLMWNQRSVDTFLGLPFNIASYGLLLEIIAKEVNMVPDELIGTLGDVHLYKNHIEQAKEQLTREPMELPKLNNFVKGLTYVDNRWQYYEVDNFTLENYQSHPTIKAPLNN